MQVLWSSSLHEVVVCKTPFLQWCGLHVLVCLFVSLILCWLVGSLVGGWLVNKRLLLLLSLWLLACLHVCCLSVSSLVGCSCLLLVWLLLVVVVRCCLQLVLLPLLSDCVFVCCLLSFLSNCVACCCCCCCCCRRRCCLFLFACCWWWCKYSHFELLFVLIIFICMFVCLLVPITGRGDLNFWETWDSEGRKLTSEQISEQAARQASEPARKHVVNLSLLIQKAMALQEQAIEGTMKGSLFNSPVESPTQIAETLQE